MGGVSYITAVLVSAAAFAGSVYMYSVVVRKPDVTQQELAPLVVTMVTSGIGFVVALIHVVAYYAYYRDDLKAWRDERRKQAGPQLHTLLDRIRREKRNFEQLRDEKPPAGGFIEYTEVTPFELLAKDLKPVADIWGYRRLVRKLLKEIARIQVMPRGQKNVTKFVPLVERLEAKLEVDVKGYPKRS